MISASVGVNSSLLLEPAQTLTFALDRQHAAASGARACLTLTNISPRKHVAFKVRTTNVEMFMVKPAQGVLEPQSELPIVVTLLPDACASLLDMDAVARAALIERFLVQSIDRSDDMRGFNVDDLSLFWKRIPKELVTNKKLTCRFIEARDAEPAVHLPVHRIRLKSDEPILEDQPHVVRHYPPPRMAFASSQPPPVAHGSSPPRSVDEQRKRLAMSAASIPPPSPPSPTPQRDWKSQSHPLPQAQRSPARGPAPSSPVPSLRPKPVFTPNSSSSGSVGDIPTGYSQVTSLDSYATSNGAQQYDEHIQSDEIREFRIHPNEALTFPVRHTPAANGSSNPNGKMEGKTYFFITNRAKYSGLIFKIKTSNHTGYFVKPARGLVGATSALRVDVFVNAPDASQFNARERERRDRFLVELLFVDAAIYDDLSAVGEDERRQQLQHVWDDSKPSDRSQTVLMCQILEEGTPIDPTQQTAEQARALMHKTPPTSLSFIGNRRRNSSGESAVPYVHPPPPLLDARIVRPEPYYEYMQTQQQQQPPRSPHMQTPRSSGMRTPRSPGIQTPRSFGVQTPRSQGMQQQQPRSPVRHHPPQYQQEQPPRSPARQQPQHYQQYQQEQPPRSPARQYSEQYYQQEPPPPPPRSPRRQYQQHQQHQPTGHYYGRSAVSPARPDGMAGRVMPRAPPPTDQYDSDSDCETFYA